MVGLAKKATLGWSARAAGPTVSVVIPCYNHARFLPEAIESVLRQTHGDAEVVVVDDGSTDATPEVVARYPEVVYRRQANQGLSAARNAGFRASRGAFLVFLDADDRLLPGALEAGLACFARHPDAAFVSGGHRRMAADGTPLPSPAARVRADHYLALLHGNYIGMPAAVMYRREALERLGPFDARFSPCEDYELTLRIARTHPVAHHAGIVAEYRQHGANMSRDVARMLGTALAVLRAQAPHAGSDPRRRAAIRAGRRAWKTYYADVLLGDLQVRLRAPGERVAAARAVAALVRLAPWQLAWRAARRSGRQGIRSWRLAAARWRAVARWLAAARWSARPARGAAEPWRRGP